MVANYMNKKRMGIKIGRVGIMFVFLSEGRKLSGAALSVFR